LGGADLSRFGGDQSYQFLPKQGWNRLVRLRLTGRRNNVKVTSVHVLYADGFSSEAVLWGLQGELKSGSAKEAILDGRPVFSIVITATPEYFWKRPGGYHVDATALR
jgi:hypothetical protein